MSVRPLALALAAVMVAACSASTASRSLVGDYDLTTVNGTPLPWVDVSGARVTSGTATMRADGTFHLELWNAGASYPPAPTTIDGQWARNANQLLYYDGAIAVDGPPLASGTFGDGTITYVPPNGYVFAFLRR